MSFKLLQKVRVLETAEEYSDVHGEIGVVIQMRQAPNQTLPFICLQLNKGEVIEDLLPCDIEICAD